MEFTAEDKLKALAIVSVFETSKPFGDFAAVAVLDDGAGISYGFSQFTHRWGALCAVAERYLETGGVLGRAVIASRLPLLRKGDRASVAHLSTDAVLKKALRAAAVSREMREAQMSVAFERYLKPAIDACEGSGFVMPLSLAVIYDSMIHGSWEKLRDRVWTRGQMTNDALFEKRWIYGYVQTRDRWLRGIPRLRPTTYRTEFFLAQIARGNWSLDLPLMVHGVPVDREAFAKILDTSSFLTHDEHTAAASGPEEYPAVESAAKSADNPASTHHNSSPGSSDAGRTQAALQPSPAEVGPLIDRIERRVDRAAARYDQTERIVNTVVTRKDAAKSLWTTIAGTICQTFWAVFGLLSGVPREVWFVVAVIAAGLTLLYLYRQIALGKIRESSASSVAAYSPLSTHDSKN